MASTAYNTKLPKMKNNQAKLNAKLKTVIDEQLEVYDLIAVFSELEINITHKFF